MNTVEHRNRVEREEEDRRLAHEVVVLKSVLQRAEQRSAQNRQQLARLGMTPPPAAVSAADRADALRRQRDRLAAAEYALVPPPAAGRLAAMRHRAAAASASLAAPLPPRMICSTADRAEARQRIRAASRVINEIAGRG